MRRGENPRDRGTPQRREKVETFWPLMKEKGRGGSHSGTCVCSGVGSLLEKERKNCTFRWVQRSGKRWKEAKKESKMKRFTRMGFVLCGLFSKENVTETHNTQSQEQDLRFYSMSACLVLSMEKESPYSKQTHKTRKRYFFLSLQLQYF